MDEQEYLTAGSPSELYAKVLPADALPPKTIETEFKIKGRYSMRVGAVPTLEASIEMEMPIVQVAELMGLKDYKMLTMLFKADGEQGGEFSMVYACEQIKAVIYSGDAELRISSNDADEDHVFAAKSGRIQPEITDKGWPILHVSLSLIGAVESREIFDDRLDDEGVVKAKIAVRRIEAEPKLI